VTKITRHTAWQQKMRARL